MSSYADDIRRIAKQKDNKQGLGSADERLPIAGSTKSMTGSEQQLKNIVGPLTLEILTYDDTQDVLIQATNGDFTIKTAATAQIIDANDRVIEIDNIIYAQVP